MKGAGKEGLGFPGRLLQLRLQKRITQKELADTVGLHKNHIGRYERGQSEPSSDKLRKLAEALGVSSDYLLNGSTEDAARADFADRDLLAMFEHVEKFPEDKKNMVKEFLGALINQEKIREMAGSR